MADKIGRTEKIFTNFWARIVSVSLLVGGLLAVAGAFETDNLPLLPRLLYWISTIFLGNIIALLVAQFLDRIAFLEDRIIFYHIVHLLLISAFIVVMVTGVNAVFLGSKFHAKILIQMYPTVFLVSLFMTIVHLVLAQIPMQSHSIPERANTQNEISLYARLPFKFKKAQIYAVNAEDHYLKIHTDAGETMVLMRLYDAIKELDGIEGSQTHRSWWVAKDAIAEVVKGDGRVSLRLKNDIMAPVSRSFQNALKNQDWI